jgi:pimeloyl-ACP methyl ester carboxylesterase
MLREHSARLPGRTVRYLESGAGWPVVLLHAFPLCAEMWAPQLDSVPDGYRFLAPDLRGFGPAATDAATTLDDMAGDVIDWLDALGIETAVMGGLSMGGYVTFAIFRRAPERFSGVILANTRAGADTTEGRAGRDRMSALVRASGPAAVAEQMLPRLLGETSRRARPELVDCVERLILVNRADGLDGAVRAMRDRPDSTELLPRVGVPALIVAGEEDALIPMAEHEAMSRLLPRSQLVRLATAGHLSSLETPAEFSAALRDFLHASY